MLLNNADARRCSYFELGLPMIFAALSLTLDVFHALIDLSFPVVYAIVGVPGSQKGDSFRENNGSCFDWSF